MLFRLVREDFDRHGRSLANPAFAALAVYRYGRWARDLRWPPGRWLARRSHGLIGAIVANMTKVWLPPEVEIGTDFHIIHAEGSLSIHPEAVLGHRVGVMHNVTIGTNMGPGAPVIGDDVFIGVNSTVLGPVRVGDRVRIAACTCVTTDVPSDSIVVGSPARIYRRLTPFRALRHASGAGETATGETAPAAPGNPADVAPAARPAAAAREAQA